MGSDSNGFFQPSNADLAAELARLGVSWVAVSQNNALESVILPATLLAALASSDEARLRLALIPLLLARPEYTQSALEAAGLVTDQPRNTFICYYTAAMLLQKKHKRRLVQLEIDHEEILDHFGSELGLPQLSNPDDRLKLLAEKQALLSGRPLNWYGTYEHAAARFLRRYELEKIWAAN